MSLQVDYLTGVFLLKALKIYDKISNKEQPCCVAGWADLSFYKRMEVMPMRNHFDFKDVLTFGIFLLALLTFVFTFCK